MKEEERVNMSVKLKALALLFYLTKMRVKMKEQNENIGFAHSLQIGHSLVHIIRYFSNNSLKKMEKRLKNLSEWMKASLTS